MVNEFFNSKFFIFKFTNIWIILAKPTVIINQAVTVDNQQLNNGQFNNANNQNTIVNNSTASSTGDELIKICLGETNQMPNFGTVNLDNIHLPPGCTLDDVKKFEELYKQHCDVNRFFKQQKKIKFLLIFFI